MGMNTNHFTAFYQLMGFALSPTITVFKSNGDVIARNPAMKDHVGKNYIGGQLFRGRLLKADNRHYLA